MRRATWILWLMLALLPLRSWAVASMAVPQVTGAGGPSIAAVAADAEGASPAVLLEMPPCHGAADGGGAPSPDANLCQACDWCHAALGLAPPAEGTASAPPVAVSPAALAARDTGRAALDGLERPPRPRPA